MLARLLDRLDQATRPAQYVIAVAVGMIIDELAQWRVRRPGG